MIEINAIVLAVSTGINGWNKQWCWVTGNYASGFLLLLAFPNLGKKANYSVYSIGIFKMQ